MPKTKIFVEVKMPGGARKAKAPIYSQRLEKAARLDEAVVAVEQLQETQTDIDGECVVECEPFEEYLFDVPDAGIFHKVTIPEADSSLADLVFGQGGTGTGGGETDTGGGDTGGDTGGGGDQTTFQNTLAPLANTGVGSAGPASTLGLSTNPKIAYDRRIGKIGTTPGLFFDPRDFDFYQSGAQKFVYVLERARVQKIALTETTTGEVSVAQYSLSALTTDAHSPTSIAVRAFNGQPRLYVAYPTLKCVMIIDADGTAQKLTLDPALPQGIYALCNHGNLIYGIAQAPSTIATGEFATHVVQLNADGSFEELVALSRPVQYARRIAVDDAGNIFIHAWKYQIFKFSPSGTLLQTYGNGFAYPNVVESPIGTQFHQSMAVKGDGTLYSTKNNLLARIQDEGDSYRTTTVDANLSSDGLLAGGASQYPQNLPSTVLRADGDGQLWVLTHNPNAVGGAGSDLRPLLVRVRENIWTDTRYDLRDGPPKTLGLSIDLDHVEPYGLFYEVGTGHIAVKVTAGPKPLPSLYAVWTMSDETGAAWGSGNLTVPLVTALASTSLSFPVPQQSGAVRFGWYLVDVQFYDVQGGELLVSHGKHIIVTPEWPQMVEPARRLTAGEKGGGDQDPSGAGFGGQTVRFNADGQKPTAIASARAGMLKCIEYDVPFFFQVTSWSAITSANLLPLVAGLGDICKNFEIINEPTTGDSTVRLTIAQELVHLQNARTIIKGADPSINILGPCLETLSTTELGQFFAGGGGALIDGFTTHDYPGNNTYDLNYFNARYTAIRALLAANNCAGKPMWQTERGSRNQYAQVLAPFLQLTNLTLQRDNAAKNGIPAARNHVFYLNDHGFDFLSWLFNKHGFYPALLAHRTHWALVKRKPVIGDLNFGTHGNRFYQGVGYGDNSGAVYSLQEAGVVCPQTGFTPQFGARDGRTLNFLVGGYDGSVTVYDCYGNARTVAIVNGALPLRLTQTPQFVILPANATLTAPVLSWGASQIAGLPAATGTTWNWTGNSGVMTDWNGNATTNSSYARDFAKLTDSTLGSTATKDVPAPSGKSQYWQGNFPITQDSELGTLITFGSVLSASFDAPRTVSRIVAYGAQPDESWAALLDYDVEVQNADNSWTLVHEVRTNFAPTLKTTLDPAQAIGYADAGKTHIWEFSSRSIKAFRVTVLKTTYGSEPDLTAQQIRRKLIGAGQPAHFVLGQIEVY